MSSETIAKCVGKQLRYYFEVKRLEDGFDLSGVSSPQLFHPPLKVLPVTKTTVSNNTKVHSPYSLPIVKAVNTKRSTLQYDGLHDRALKHYFSQPEVKTCLTKMHPGTNGEMREEDMKRLLKRYMYKHRYIHPTMPEWIYKSSPTCRRAIKPEYVGFGVGLKSQKHKRLKGGYPILRSVPNSKINRAEAQRLIDVATKILIATEKVNEIQCRPETPAYKQAAPKQFESKNREHHGDSKKKRPSTAKNAWDIDGHRHVKVKAYDDSFVPDWLLHQQQKKEKRSKSPPPKHSPRPSSAKLRQQEPIREMQEPQSVQREPLPLQREPNQLPPLKPMIINLPEPPDNKEEVSVHEGTQTADTVGIQTEKHLLDNYDHKDEEVRDGAWAEYQLHVKTGDRIGASTKADVKVTLYGEKGRTKEITLGQSSRNKIKFQKGNEDVFLVPAHHVGKLYKIKIGHDLPTLRNAWYLDGVSVYDMHDKRVYEFKCNSWLSNDRTYKEIQLDSDRAFVQVFDDLRGQESPKAGKNARTIDTSSESKASKNDKRSQESVKGSKGEQDSDTDKTSSSSSSSSSSSGSSSSSEDRQKNGRKSAMPPLRHKSLVKELESSPKMSEEEFFHKAPGPTFTFKSYSGDGKSAEVDYLSGFKAGLEAVSTDRKQQHDHGEDKRKMVLEGLSIHDATRQGDLQRVQNFIHYLPDMKESKDETGLTPLHIASQQGRLEIVKLLIGNSVELETETQTGYTAIHLAAMNGHLNCVIVLAAMGASLNCVSVDQQTPLHVAAMNGHLECVKWLIANRSRLSDEDQLGRTALQLAEEYQHREVADFLRKCDAEMHDTNSSLHALRSNRKGSDSSKEKLTENVWQNDSKPGQPASDLDGNNARPKSDVNNVQEKRRIYEEQHQRMKTTGTSFLDSIRDEVAN